MPNRWFRASGIVPFLLAAALPVGAAYPEFPSGWRSAEVKVDGSAEEWAGKLVPVGTTLLLGIQNDASFLYVCLKTSDEATRKRILALGLNFYFDASGKADKAFGIRYPASPEPPPTPADGASQGGATRRRRTASLEDIEILGRGEAEAGRMTVAQARPVAAALSENDGVFVVELKVPLAFSIDTPFAVQANPGQTIALGVEGAKPAAPRPDKGRGREGGGREGTRIGGGGGRGGFGSGGGGYRPGYGGTLGGEGGEGRRGEGRSSDRPDEKSLGKPIKTWFRVPLASGPSPDPAPGPAQTAPR